MQADRQGQGFLAFVWLALATILANALAPTGSAVEISSGSAFNPFTSEVSLGPTRATAAPKAKVTLGVATDGKAGGLDRSGSPAVLAQATHDALESAAVEREPLTLHLPVTAPAPRGFQARAPPSV